jgi:Fur family transcriptional regulator, peroxide stress response regulator
MLSREIIQDRIQNFRTVMHHRKLPITPQKLAIFRYLASTEEHPSAQKIFERMQTYFPNISFATVYKNLKKFAELHLIREIEMKSGMARYDANMDPHHHLINLDNAQIQDIDTQEVGEVSIPKTANEYELESISINFFVRNKPPQTRYDRLKRRPIHF